MKRLDEREQRIALLAAALAAGTWVALWAASQDKGRAAVWAAIGLVLSGLLALAARKGGRVLTGVAAVALGWAPWGFLGLPYLGLAAWLLFKGARARRMEREAATETPRAGPKERVASTSPRSTRPRANKRYTPPRRKR